jgi:exopolysaccharide biosynthesis polyprenyl glycosylphosphotransferase
MHGSVEAKEMSQREAMSDSEPAVLSADVPADRAELLDEIAASQPAASTQGGAVMGDRRGFVLRRLSLATDMLAMLLVGLLTVITLDLVGRPTDSLNFPLYLFFILLWPVVGVTMRAYHPHSIGRGLSITIADEFATIFRVSTAWSWFFLVARTLVSAEQIQVLPSLLIWALSVPIVLLSRSLLRLLARSTGWYGQQVLVIGRAQDAEKVISRIERHPEWCLTVTREIDVAGSRNGDGPLAAVDTFALAGLIEGSGISRVIFATPPEQLAARTDLTRAFIELGMQVDFVPGEAEILRSGAEISHLEGLPLMSMPGARQPRSWGVMKRSIDLGIGVPALVALSPLIALTAIRIKLDSPGPVLYRQVRAGRDGKHFSFLKLRTMVVDAESKLEDVAELSLHEGSADSGVFKAVEDPRVTGVGKGLRRRSLDELPQLWNVVKGNMSLVGPRPLPIFEDERVAGHYELRRHVRPGMTGPWQVNGRSDIPFSDMLRLDYSYVLNWSLAGDLKLLMQTVAALVRGHGAY